MDQARWLLAHAKNAKDDDLQRWQAVVAPLLQVADWETWLRLSRDDFKEHAAAAGGWKPWLRRCIEGEDWAGNPHYHGIVVPLPGDGVEALGRATCQLVEGFLAQGKYVYAFDPDDADKIYKVLGVELLPGNSWVAFAKLVLEEE